MTTVTQYVKNKLFLFPLAWSPFRTVGDDKKRTNYLDRKVFEEAEPHGATALHGGVFRLLFCDLPGRFTNLYENWT